MLEMCSIGYDCVGIDVTTIVDGIAQPLLLVLGYVSAHGP